MQPYYEQDGITIYHGDCREILPGLSSVDLVLTDPPYGLHYQGEGWDAERPDWLPWVQGLAPVVAFTTAPLTMWDYPRPDWVLCWARPASNSRSLLGGFNHWSPVLVYGKPKFPVDLISLHAIQHSAPIWIKHPSPKPEALMRWLVRYGCSKGGTVLDPFMGSGATLRAAVDMGRQAIGIEIEERYCEIAANRLRQMVLPLECPA